MGISKGVKMKNIFKIISIVILNFLIISNLKSSDKVTLIKEIGNFKDMGLFSYVSYYNSNYFLFHTFQQWSRMVIVDDNYNQVKVIDSIYYTEYKKNNIDIISKEFPTNVLFDSENKVYYYYSKNLPKYLFRENINEYIKYEPVPNDTNDIIFAKFTNKNTLFMQKGENHFYVTKDTIETYSLMTQNYELFAFQSDKDKSVFIGDTTFYYNSDKNIVKYFKGKFDIWDYKEFTNNFPYTISLQLRTYKDTLYCPVFVMNQKIAKIIRYIDTSTIPEDLTIEREPCENLKAPIIHAYNIDLKGRHWLIVFDQSDVLLRKFLWVKENGEWKNLDINKLGFSDSLYLGDWIYSDSPKVIIPVMNLRTNQMNHLIFDESFNSIDEIEKTEKMPNFYLENIYPNPSNQMFNISLSVNSSHVDKLKIELMNSIGQIITQIIPDKIVYDNSTGLANILFNSNQIQKGYYFLTISDGEITRTRSIVIQ